MTSRKDVSDEKNAALSKRGGLGALVGSLRFAIEFVELGMFRCVA